MDCDYRELDPSKRALYEAIDGADSSGNAAGEVASFLLKVVALPFLAGAAEGRANQVKSRESYTCMHMGVMTDCTKDY